MILKKQTTMPQPDAMQEGLSVLIPVYNHKCLQTVKRIKHICDGTPGLAYEILVADDGSTDADALECNAAIGEMANCKLYKRQQNSGSAATRNFLAEQGAYPWLLFLDCDVDIPDDGFVGKYLQNRVDGAVVSGGVKTCRESKRLKSNLRYVYEHNAEASYTAAMRSKRPYKSFRSVNFLMQKDLFLSVRFNEGMKRFEDVFFGKVLQERGIRIRHIDNPVEMGYFEDNAAYLKKIETDLLMLDVFREELSGFSTMLDCEKALRAPLLQSSIKLWHKLFGRLERRVLVGDSPNLAVFNLYRIGFFISNQ